MSDLVVPGGWGKLSADSLEQIRENLERTPAHPDALCLVAEDDHELVGFVTASLTHHPVMPRPDGEIEELYVRPLSNRATVRAELARRAIEWLGVRGVGVTWSRVALDAPWTADEIAFWTGLGFDNDQALLSRYQSETA